MANQMATTMTALAAAITLAIWVVIGTIVGTVAILGMHLVLVGKLALLTGLGWGVVLAAEFILFGPLAEWARR
jgi:hypothetical protein